MTHWGHCARTDARRIGGDREAHRDRSTQGRAGSTTRIGTRSLDHVQETEVARVVVDVMPKPEILDPQGKAVLGALPRLGFDGVSDVRQGKRFELEIDGELTDDRLAEVEQMAETLLSNPVIEDYAVRVLS
jgi:phosphoribosylformylglycinamidine synthase PurS subunit